MTEPNLGERGDQSQGSNQPVKPPAPRQFPKAAGAATAPCPAGCYLGPYPSVPSPNGLADWRAYETYELRRTRAAVTTILQPVPAHPCNGDEVAYGPAAGRTFIGSFSKGLKHDGQTGQVDPVAYCAFTAALDTHHPAAYTPAGFLKVGVYYDAVEALEPHLGCGGGAAPAAGPMVQERLSAQVAAIGNQLPLVNPVAAVALDLEGIDSHQATVFHWTQTVGGAVMRSPFPAAPAFASAEEVAEIAENYWMALARDVPFEQYAATPLTIDAAADLSRYADFKGPKDATGNVTPATLFKGFAPLATLKGTTSTEFVGPYVSQFLLRPVPYGSRAIDARIRAVKPVTAPDGTFPAALLGGRDWMTDFDSWLDVQRGCRQPPDQFDPNPRYIYNGRTLGQFVHVDVLYDAYLNAALLLSAAHDPTAMPPGNFALGLAGSLGGGLSAPLQPGNPYSMSKVQTGFGTLGAGDIVVLLAEVAKRALKAVWYQKWSVHRRLRPEAFAGRIEVHNNNRNIPSPTPVYPFEPGNFALLGTGLPGKTSILDRVFDHNQKVNDANKPMGAPTAIGSHLMPMAYPEGSPLHPAYGAGHATVAGACVTVLKALFEDVKLADLRFRDPADGMMKPFFVPVVASDDGLQLVEYMGADAGDMTVHGELDKLAVNIARGRDIAGVHWRSDAIQSIRLGEAIALWFLCDLRNTYKEKFCFSFRTFGSTTRAAAAPIDPDVVYYDEIAIQNTDDWAHGCFSPGPCP